jgi:transcriptional regulator with XRE-family HTH domain
MGADQQRFSVDPTIATGELYVPRPARAGGARLKILREERGLSVPELSERSGVSASVIYRLEKGWLRQSWVEMHTVRKLAGALGVESGELLAG